MKLEKLCSLLGKFDSFRMVSDFLLDIIMDDQGHRKEAIFVLNGVIAGNIIHIFFFLIKVN